MQIYRQNQIEFLTKLSAEKGKNLHLNMMGMDIYMIADADLVHPLLLENVDKVHRDPFSHRTFKRMTGEGVLVAEDDKWKYQRKMIQPAFHSQRITAYADTMVAYANDMLRTWQDGDILQIDEQFSELTQRIIVKTMFNRDIDSFTAALGKPMATLLRIAEEQLSALPIPEWIPTIPRWQQQKARKEIMELIDTIIAERMENPEDEGDLLSMLLAARDENGQALPLEQIRDECMTLFIAGHETTAVTLTWVFHLLAQNPDAVKKLQAEADSVLQGKAPTLKDLSELKYTEMVVKEALRLYPPAWSIGRTALEDISLGNDVITKDSLILFNIYNLHRQAEYFPEPERFMPERFSEPTHPRYAYIPFGAGRRTCIGNQFAMLEAVLILSRIMQDYRLSPVENQEVIAEPMITLRPKGGLKMRVETL